MRLSAKPVRASLAFSPASTNREAKLNRDYHQPGSSPAYNVTFGIGLPEGHWNGRASSLAMAHEGTSTTISMITCRLCGCVGNCGVCLHETAGKEISLERGVCLRFSPSSLSEYSMFRYFKAGRDKYGLMNGNRRTPYRQIRLLR